MSDDAQSAQLAMQTEAKSAGEHAVPMDFPTQEPKQEAAMHAANGNPAQLLGTGHAPAQVEDLMGTAEAVKDPGLAAAHDQQAPNQAVSPHSTDSASAERPSEEAAAAAAAPAAKPVLSAAQWRQAQRQRAEFARQVSVLKQILEKQAELTGQDALSGAQAGEAAGDPEPVTAEAHAAAPAAPGAALPASSAAALQGGALQLAAAAPATVQTGAEAAPGAPTQAPVSPPPAKAPKMAPEAEQALLAFFALQDMLSREDARMLARQTGCTEAQVREYFTKLRASVRNFLQRMQRKASASSAPPAAAAAPAAAMPAGMLPAAAAAAAAAAGPGQSGGLPGALQLGPSGALSVVMQGGLAGSTPAAAQGAAMPAAASQGPLPPVPRQHAPGSVPTPESAHAHGAVTASQMPQSPGVLPSSALQPAGAVAAQAPALPQPAGESAPAPQQGRGPAGADTAAGQQPILVTPNVAAMLAQLKAAAQQQPSILSGLASVLTSAGHQSHQAQVQQQAASGPAPAMHGHGFVAVSPGQAGAAPLHQAAADAGLAALRTADAAREAAVSKLRGLLDAGGGLASDQHAGAFVALAAGTGSAEARHELIAALLATREKLTLARMVATGQLLGLLDRRAPHPTFSQLAACCVACSPMRIQLRQKGMRSWTRWAEADRQTTLLRLLLGALHRLPIPWAMLRSSGLPKTVARLQKYRVASVGFMASNLLQHWMHLEPAPQPPSFPAAAKQPVITGAAAATLPAVKIQIARAAPQQAPPQQVPQSPREPASSQRSFPAPPTPKAEPAAAAARQPLPAAAFQKSHGQAQQLAPAKPFYRGVAGRMGLADKGGKAAAAVMKPLTADEIVRQRDKARARAAEAAGLPGRAAPPKAARFLDAASLLDAARDRRPGGAPAKTAFPPSRQGGGSRGSIGQASCATGQRYLDLRGPQQQQQQQQQRRPGSGRELAAVVPWAPPMRLRMPAAEEGSGPAAGEESHEAGKQRARSQALPEATYLMPELIPASPAELWADEANGHAQPREEPPRVPLLPLDPGEAEDTVRMLCAAGLPPESIMGHTAGRGSGQAAASQQWGQSGGWQNGGLKTEGYH